MTGHRARVAVFALLVCVATGGIVAADRPNGVGGTEAFATSDVDPDRTRIDVELTDSGTANWTIEYRVALANDNETAAFEDLQAEIRANRSAYVRSFRQRLGRTARAAENATNRSMAIENVTVATGRESIQEFGTVTYRFRWRNFSRVVGDTVQAGDALSGFFLEANTRMTVTWPAAFEATTLLPDPDERSDGSATWIGPVDFGPNGPEVIVSPAGGPPVWLLGVSALIGLALAGGLWYVINRDELAEATGDGSRDEGDGEPDPLDDELLSNEERVLKLLEERGGRVKQQEVAAAFDWTDAKTSQVVTSLREEEEIDVFRLGRENVLVLPEEGEL